MLRWFKETVSGLSTAQKTEIYSLYQILGALFFLQAKRGDKPDDKDLDLYVYSGKIPDFRCEPCGDTYPNTQREIIIRGEAGKYTAEEMHNSIFHNNIPNVQRLTQDQRDFLGKLASYVVASSAISEEHARYIKDVIFNALGELAFIQTVTGHRSMTGISVRNRSIDPFLCIPCGISNYPNTQHTIQVTTIMLSDTPGFGQELSVLDTTTLHNIIFHGGVIHPGSRDLINRVAIHIASSPVL